MAPTVPMPANAVWRPPDVCGVVHMVAGVMLQRFFGSLAVWVSSEAWSVYIEREGKERDTPHRAAEVRSGAIRTFTDCGICDRGCQLLSAIVRAIAIGRSILQYHYSELRLKFDELISSHRQPLATVSH